MRLFNVVAVLCLAVIGCAEFKDEKTENKDRVNVRVSAQNLSDFIKVEVQPTTEPEKYMVYFGWPKMSDPLRVRIRMEQILAVVDANQTTFSHEVGHNQTLSYTFDILGTDNKIENSFSKLVKIPRDFVVRIGQSSISEDTQITVNRIFLTKEIPLTTNGFSLELVTNEFHSKDGIIETFSENSKAPINSDGKSGGNLKINTQLATGDLKIFMRGQNGGNGANGESYLSRANDGAAAGTGSLFCECVGRNCFIPASKKYDFLENLNTESITCYCESKGNDGGVGANGAKGRKGYRAGNGGSSGELKVSIQDGREFNLQTFSFKGVAGVPGDGGEGQDGGIGGQRPVNDRQSQKCGGAIGSNGSKGPKGDRGEIGTDGKLGLMCVYIASEGKNDCY